VLGVAEAIAAAAAKAPTDAHMTLMVAAKILHQVLRKWSRAS
jgi:hypothetical protein